MSTAAHKEPHPGEITTSHVDPQTPLLLEDTTVTPTAGASARSEDEVREGCEGEDGWRDEDEEEGNAVDMNPQQHLQDPIMVSTSKASANEERKGKENEKLQTGRGDRENNREREKAASTMDTEIVRSPAGNVAMNTTASMDSQTSPPLAVDSFLTLEGTMVEADETPVTLSLTGNESTEIDPLALALSLVGNTETGVDLHTPLSLAEDAHHEPVDSVGADMSSSRKQGQINDDLSKNYELRSKKRKTYQL